MLKDLSNQEQQVVCGGLANPLNNGKGSENSLENGRIAIFKSPETDIFDDSGVANSDHFYQPGTGQGQLLNG